MSNKGVIRNANNTCTLQANLEHKGALLTKKNQERKMKLIPSHLKQMYTSISVFQSCNVMHYCITFDTAAHFYLWENDNSQSNLFIKLIV